MFPFAIWQIRHFCRKLGPAPGLREVGKIASITKASEKLLGSREGQASIKCGNLSMAQDHLHQPGEMRTHPT